MSFTFDLYWSMRSPYCYLSLDRIMALRAAYELTVDVRIVYPVAVRNPDFFKTAPAHYRSYHLLDSQRVADTQGIPYRRPKPDPILQNMATNEIAIDQPYIRGLTRLATAAVEQGRGLEFLDHVMRLLWDGQTENWDQEPHLADAIRRAGLDAQALDSDVTARPGTFEGLIEANQAAQIQAGHSGVPLMVFENEPFFGQDRLDLLLWRMKSRGLKERANAKR